MKIKFWLKKIFFIIFSIVLIAGCVNMLLGPHNIAAGGLTGLAIILEQWMGVSRSLVVYIGNGLVLIFAFVFLGKEIIGYGLFDLLKRSLKLIQ